MRSSFELQWMGFETTFTVSLVDGLPYGAGAGHGWTATGDPVVADGFEITVYERGNESLNVLVIADQTATRVDTWRPSVGSRSTDKRGSTARTDICRCRTVSFVGVLLEMR